MLSFCLSMLLQVDSLVFKTGEAVDNSQGCLRSLCSTVYSGFSRKDSVKQ